MINKRKGEECLILHLLKTGNITRRVKMSSHYWRQALYPKGRKEG